MILPSKLTFPMTPFKICPIIDTIALMAEDFNTATQGTYALTADDGYISLTQGEVATVAGE